MPPDEHPADPPRAAPPAGPTRLEREAEALRANLHRRKQQARARATPPADPLPHPVPVTDEPDR